jgi:hypothetical protein
MKFAKLFITFTLIFPVFCFAQSSDLQGPYELNRKLHLWNPYCDRSQLVLEIDSTYTFVDCDWNAFDTIIGTYSIDKRSISLISPENKLKKLYYNGNGDLFNNKTRRFFGLVDYEKIKTSN